jgi:hypothetical protein
VVAILLALALASPPRATISTGAAAFPLAVSSWCWGAHCGAPIAASTKTAVVSRGALVRIDLSFVPTHVALAIAGKPVAVTTSGHEVSWHAEAGGGMSVNATGAKGWVIYVSRLRLR